VPSGGSFRKFASRQSTTKEKSGVPMPLLGGNPRLYYMSTVLYTVLHPQLRARVGVQQNRWRRWRVLRKATKVVSIRCHRSGPEACPRQRVRIFADLALYGNPVSPGAALQGIFRAQNGETTVLCTGQWPWCRARIRRRCWR
jgi:hypothetical protein